MTISEIIVHLATWTPFLFGGFLWNIMIALLAVVMGSALGGALTWAQLSEVPVLSKISIATSNTFLKIPTIVLMFYCAVLIPNEVRIPGTQFLYSMPGWVKAALALSAAQVGFTSRNLFAAVNFWKASDRAAALLLVPTWGSNLLITVIASSAASLVGVDEIVSRCSKVINASQNAELALPMYAYTSLFFLVFCYPITLLLKYVQQRLTQHLAMPIGS